MKDVKLTHYQKYKENAQKAQQEKIQKKYEGKIEGEEYIVCKICGTETFTFPDLKELIEKIEYLFSDTEETLRLFKSEFNLKYEEKFI